MKLLLNINYVLKGQLHKDMIYFLNYSNLIICIPDDLSNVPLITILYIRCSSMYIVWKTRENPDDDLIKIKKEKKKKKDILSRYIPKNSKPAPLMGYMNGFYDMLRRSQNRLPMSLDRN